MCEIVCCTGSKGVHDGASAGGIFAHPPRTNPSISAGAVFYSVVTLDSWDVLRTLDAQSVPCVVQVGYPLIRGTGIPKNR